MTKHPQVDSGLGFQCDEEIVDLIRLIHKFPGITTTYSCQGGPAKWATAYVIFNGDTDKLVTFCKCLMPVMLSEKLWDEDHICIPTSLQIMFQREHGIRGELTVPYSLIGYLCNALSNLLVFQEPHVD